MKNAKLSFCCGLISGAGLLSAALLINAGIDELGGMCIVAAILAFAVAYSVWPEGV